MLRVFRRVQWISLCVCACVVILDGWMWFATLQSIYYNDMATSQAQSAFAMRSVCVCFCVWRCNTTRIVLINMYEYIAAYSRQDHVCGVERAGGRQSWSIHQPACHQHTHCESDARKQQCHTRSVGHDAGVTRWDRTERPTTCTNRVAAMVDVAIVLFLYTQPLRLLFCVCVVYTECQLSSVCTGKVVWIVADSYGFRGMRSGAILRQICCRQGVWV